MVLELTVGKDGKLLFLRKLRPYGFVLTQCMSHNVSHATLQEYCK